jgi:hypothetical protein
MSITRLLFLLAMAWTPACNNGHMSRMDEFKLRSECAAQAEKVAAESRWKPLGGAFLMKSVQNHYNRELNRCFVHVHTMEASLTMDVIVDAYEDSILVNCSRISSGQRSCNAPNTQTLNPEEADKRIKNYMEH